MVSTEHPFQVQENNNYNSTSKRVLVNLKEITQEEYAIYLSFKKDA